MNNLIKEIFQDVDNKGSSKRIILLWIGIVLWTFIHIAIFELIKPFPLEIASTLILYDMVLICSLAGLALSEKIWGRDKSDIKKDE